MASLILLDDEAGRQALLKALQTTDQADLENIAGVLWRVRNPEKLGFARQQLETSAANASLKEATRLSLLRLLNEKRLP